MLDEEGAKNLFEQLNTMWIEPELLRRRQNGTLPDDFQIFRFLIRLPKDHPPIVEFNDEIGWIAKVKAAPRALNGIIGKPVFLHDIQEIETVGPPEVEGQRVAFFYCYWDGFNYKMFLDLTPNAPDFDQVKEDQEEWALEKLLQNPCKP